jgi:hypothetical protein
MRARLQKTNVLTLPKYEKDLVSIIIYDDNDNPLFVAGNSVSGGQEFSYVGMPDFDKIFESITGTKPKKVNLVELNNKNA